MKTTILLLAGCLMLKAAIPGDLASSTYSLSPTSATINAAMGSGNVALTTPTWTATSDSSWLTISPSSGTGNANLTWTAAFNSTTNARTGTITIAGQTFTVTQEGSVCHYNFAISGASVPSGGGNGSVNMLADGGCSWSVTSDSSWLSSTSSGVGNGTVSYSTAPNPGTAQRIGTLRAGGQTFTVTQAGQTSTQGWAKRFGGISTDVGAAVAVDPSGNVFVTGYFATTINFGSSDLVSAGSYDLFLAKFTAAGDHVWSKRFGGAGAEVPKSIALDAAGNVFVAGGLQTCSIVKFSPNGDVLWTAGPPAADFASIAVDSVGSVVATGNFAAPFAAPIDFGNGFTLSSQFGATDCFLAKYSPSGACVFARGFANSGDAEWGYGVKVDRSDNILLAGYATGRINLGGADLQNIVYGNTFGFLGKFAPTGAHIWSRRLGVTMATDTIGSSWSRVTALAIDSNGDLLLGGHFHLHTQLAGEPVDLASVLISGTSSYYDSWLAKYSGVNGAHQWSNVVKGNQYAGFQGLAFDAQNNALATGYFYGTYTFGPQTLTTAGTSPKYSSDGFLMKVTGSNGVFISVQQFGGPLDADIGRSVSDSAVLTGSFQGTAAVGASSLTSAGGQDVLVWKLNP